MFMSLRVKCDKDFSSEYISSCGVLKALFSVLYFSCCIPPHSALSSPRFFLTTTFTQMILNFSPSIFVTLTQVGLYCPVTDCLATDFLLDVSESSYS